MNVLARVLVQTKPEAFAGQKVKVSGTMDAKTNTIKVDSIAPAS